ncbi:transcription factor TFIIIB component B''-like [Hibiscus syriacus]|uniref:transcription factor TFIIIB component B''-like n=1 Tax=Hibiscus syriacus TaxID=106335 RepID=UPI001922B547|nr:transcription factor TFIIIB component B''-like [Hibiscus syriacus]
MVELVVHLPNAHFVLSTSECLVNEEQLEAPSNTGVNLCGNVSVVPKVSSNIMERNNSLVHPSRKSKQSSTRDEVNGNGKARKQVTKPHIVDDLEDGTCNDGGLAAVLPLTYAINEDKDNNNGDENDEHNVERVSAKRRTKRSKKSVNESEKPPQKCKTANQPQKLKEVNEASDNPEKEQKKKFSHSTRRKRRFVDESLLNTQEDEIDFARVALKDLILLADYKERLAKKEAKTLGIPLIDQSNQKTFNEENARDEESSIASEQDQGFTDDQVSGSAKSSSYFNYQTYMGKEPRVRWSKLDTELFYWAIRQLGPDFSLIQQLFPGRSRHQIKLKFKNEERRSPFKLSEALASRANRVVIEQLRQVSGADPESNGDVSTDFTREEEEFTAGTNVCFLFFNFFGHRIINCDDAMLMRR